MESNTARNTSYLPVDTRNYWVYSPGGNASLWREHYNEGILAMGWNEVKNLDLTKNLSKEQLRKRLENTYSNAGSSSTAQLYNFASVMKPGDIVYARNGLSRIIGRGIVDSVPLYDETRPSFRNYRKVKWISTKEFAWPYKQMARITLNNITDKNEWWEKMEELYEEKTDVNSLANQTIDDELPEGFESPVESTDENAYTDQDFLHEVYMVENRYFQLKRLLCNKKNVIFQGAPGTGKTFAAKRLAYVLMGQKDDERVKMIQFHQSYSYEDFMMGYRPTETGGFILKKGPFYEFCQKARADDPQQKYFFVIDEINRGNISKIFGELLMLIESSKRGEKIALTYMDEEFTVPENVYLIGYMNTADRSLAIMDYALRRRFSFFEFEPAFDTDQFQKYLNQTTRQPLLVKMVEALKQLNKTIIDDSSLGKGFVIGHSFVCGYKQEYRAKSWLRAIIEFELIPLLEEYWYDDPEKRTQETEKLRNVLKG